MRSIRVAIATTLITIFCTAATSVTATGATRVAEVATRLAHATVVQRTDRLLPDPSSSVPRISSIAPLRAGSNSSATFGSTTGIAAPPDACGGPDPVAVAVAQSLVAASGISMLRCDLSWWSVQPSGPTDWNWGDTDNGVNSAAFFGIRILFVPQFTPPWARPAVIPPTSGNPSHVPPANLADYILFVRAAADRYAPTGTSRPPELVGSVSMWEIWNEPNNYGFWNPVDPFRYSDLLIGSYYAIKWIDPNAQVISGGLSPAANSGGNIAPDTFTYVLGLTGALNIIDGVGMHPYTFWAWPSEQIAWNPLVNHVPRMYYVMVSFGAGNKKIWATEAGWPTSSLSTRTIRPDGTQVATEAHQFWAMFDLLTTWNRYSYAGPMFLYEFHDECTDMTSWFCAMGLQRLDGSFKPAYFAVQSMMNLPISTFG